MLKQLNRTLRTGFISSKISKQFDATLLVPCYTELGENPLWDEIRNELLWIDASLSKLWKYNMKTNETISYTLPEKAGSFCFCNDTDTMLFSFENGPAFYDVYNKKMSQRIFRFEENKCTMPNDGRVDRNGRFVFGGRRSFDDNSGENLSSMYRINHDLSYQVLLNDINCTNSICFSLDGNEMYMTDSWKFDENGKPFIMKYRYYADDKIPPAAESSIFTNQCLSPDGSVVDNDGFVWNADYKYGRVARYDLEGNIDLIVNVKDNPSCCVFGGENLDTLFITTVDLRAKKGGFGLYSVTLPFQGIKENRFTIQKTPGVHGSA